MTPIDCRTCQDYDNGRCHNIAICHDGDLYMRAGVLRLYVVTERPPTPTYAIHTMHGSVMPPRDEP